MERPQKRHKKHQKTPKKDQDPPKKNTRNKQKRHQKLLKTKTPRPIFSAPKTEAGALYMFPSARPTNTMPFPSIIGALQWALNCTQKMCFFWIGFLWFFCRFSSFFCGFCRFSVFFWRFSMVFCRFSVFFWRFFVILCRFSVVFLRVVCGCLDRFSVVFL